MESIDLSPETEQIVKQADPAGALGLLALVKKDFLKNKKGGRGSKNGDRKGGKGGPKTCFECGAEGHIGAECPVRTARVAAGGFERLDKPHDAMKGIKGGGKKSSKKGDKGKGKFGVWTLNDDHGGSWVLTRDQLMLLSKGHEADPLDRSIDIQVSRLRHRLGDAPADPQIIKTVRGEGYVLAVPVEVER